MTPTSSPFSPGRRVAPRAVRAWLYGLAILVVVMVAVGGATRLTGSGLSITEWKPVTGAVPPLSDTAWGAEFDRYRASSQYRNLNRGMAIGEFKTIYWWEWSHRQLGRVLGLYFLLPLVGFWWRGAISGGLAAKLVGIGALGGLQATVGWIMVASGLEPGMTAVAPVKLTLHLLIASAILALIVAVAAGLGPVQGRSPRGLGREAAQSGTLSTVLVAMILGQIALGGLVAGSRAGLTYNTWPLMDGRLVPPVETLLAVRPWIENLVDNPALVQLDHRLGAYLIVALALGQAWWWRGARGSGRARLVALIALAQMALGITALLLAVPLWAGLAHQLLAMALLAAATVHAERSLAERSGPPSLARVPQPF